MNYNSNEIRKQYKELFEHALDLIYIIDLKGNFLDANDIALNMFGYNKEDLSRLSINDLIDGIQLEKASSNINEIILTGNPSKLTEYKLRTKNGMILYIETYGIPLKKDGKIYAVLGIANDITKLKLIEQKLKKSERKYRLLFKRLPISIYLINSDGIIIDCNPKSERLFGYTKHELIGRHFENISIIDQNFLLKLQDGYQKLLKGESTLPIEVKAYTKDNCQLWVKLEASLIQIGGKQYVQALFYDITKTNRS